MPQDDTPKIRKLDPSVINRIAAGEVVQRPVAAIKELLENSLDANSTSICITVKHGGLDLIQIQDNGDGIAKEDLEIVCERFTTSKLNSFDDLKSISTYGFRGEALASVTHVARVTITSRTRNSPCAFRAKYSDGKLIGGNHAIKPCASVIGTSITVEDLFFNMPTRKNAFKNNNDEYQRILDVIAKYSIHFGDKNISFSCKKHGKTIADLFTGSSSSTMDNIRSVYGTQLANQLMDVSFDCHQESSDGLAAFCVRGKISNGTYAGKKMICILFINNRLVESMAIKKVVEAAYEDILPKHSFPFVYLSISIPPQHVDVNVHPTKREVHFLHEDFIIEQLFNVITKLLANSNQSRTFYVDTPFEHLSETHRRPLNVTVEDDKSLAEPTSTMLQLASSQSNQYKRKYDVLIDDARKNKNSAGSGIFKNPSKFVRVDHAVQKIDNFFRAAPLVATSELPAPDNYCSECISGDNTKVPKLYCNCCVNERDSPKKEVIVPFKETRILFPDLVVTSCSYVSIQSLLTEIRTEKNVETEKILKQSSFVGVVNERYSLIQFETKLVMINHSLFLSQLFYQLCIFRFAEMDEFVLENEVSIEEIVLNCFDDQSAKDLFDIPVSAKVASTVCKILTEHRDMLFEYFRVRISDAGVLFGLPSLIPCTNQELERRPCCPNPQYLAVFLTTLALETNWEVEKDCFRDVSIRVGEYYSRLDPNNPHICKDLEMYFLPALRKYLVPSNSLGIVPSVLLEIATLDQLYKIFERC